MGLVFRNEPVGDAQKARPPEGPQRRPREQRAEASFADGHQLRQCLVGQGGRISAHELVESLVDRRTALGGADLRI